ncbi:Bcr/CflA family efflux MFS transporter [Sneathiella sp. P13V-1]|uniref:multidrug effflux MFS transporter n=1 Tax=Sneathiella sp. P13V-1 TaxID=2697366 RepID=UPI00187B3206|nr:multidrug effflux MFS transporter [Sneathiella sp. P13V-1]MBE7637100.1 Bcr/CflA family efflux MFS transporter [Sneathiella sp. P13V-1]
MSNEATQRLSRVFLVILVFISMNGPMGMNIVLPSLSAYQVEFNTEYATSQLALTFYLLAVAVGQLVWGPLSDQLGRRRIVMTGLLIMIIGCLICLYAPTINILIAGRMVMAFGACAGMVMGRSMVRDRYEAEAAAQVIAYLTMAIVLAPTVAPLLGGVLQDVFGWKSHFLFMIIFGGIAFIVVYSQLEETLPQEKRRTAEFKDLFLSFGALLRNPEFCAYAFQVSFATAAYFAFLGGSSFVVIDLMGGSATILGTYFVVVSVFYILGNFGTAKLAGKFGINRLIVFGCMVAITGPIAMIVWELNWGLTIESFAGLMGLVALGNGFCISSGIAAAVGADPERVGAASGLAGAMQIGMGALSTFAGGYFLTLYGDSVTPLLVVMLACVVAAPIAFLFGLGIKHRSQRI